MNDTDGRNMSRLAWMVRALLAACFVFCIEILLWIAPVASPSADRVGREWWQWGIVIAGSVALAGLALDLAARYRVRGVFGVLALAGMVAMLYGTLISPDWSLVETPRTLFTRVVGAQALISFAAWALFLSLTIGILKRGSRALVLIGIAALAFGWGGWARWAVYADDPASFNVTPEISLTAPITALIGMAVLAALWIAYRRMAAANRPLTGTGAVVERGAALKLSPLGLVITLAGLALLAILQLARGALDTITLTIALSLAGLCWAILYFQARKKGISLADVVLVGVTDPPVYWLIAGVLFVVVGAVTHQLARGHGTSDPAEWWGLIFTAFGFVWLPAAALVLGGQAFGRRARALRL